MASSKNVFLATLLFPEFCNLSYKERFNTKQAAQVIGNDILTENGVPKECTHFMISPKDMAVNVCTFPEEEIKLWNDAMLRKININYLGKQDYVIDEDCIPEVFWKYNNPSRQNENFYFHLVVERSYQDFLKTVIEKLDDNLYKFKGRTFNSNQMMEKNSRWLIKLLTELDEQFYTRLAKKYCSLTGVKANAKWLESTMKKSINQVFPKCMLKKDIVNKLTFISDKANYLVENGDSCLESWHLEDEYVDKFIGIMMKNMYNAYISLYS